MFALKDLILGEVKKGFEKTGMNPLVDFLGNSLVITIPKSDVVNMIMSGFPEHLKSIVEVEASDIKIKIRVM